VVNPLITQLSRTWLPRLAGKSWGAPATAPGRTLPLLSPRMTQLVSGPTHWPN